MTEKKQRFISLDEGYDFIIRDTITHTDLCDVDSVIDVLNDYDKENERLKKERNHFEKKKTEYLTEWNNCRIKNTELKKENKRLYEDNIRVKQLITETFNNERTELGQSVLKQLIEQI